jgi:hypothetical protein
MDSTIMRDAEGKEYKDQIREPLYDQVVISAAENPTGIRQFFSSVQGKSRAQTNLRQNNLLERGTAYRIQGLSLDCMNIYSLNFAALPLIMENSSIRVRIAEKDYWDTCALYLTGRVSSQMSAATTVAATTIDRVVQHYGDVLPNSVVFGGRDAINIPMLYSFFAEWTVSGLTAAEIAASTPSANTSLKFMFAFKGLKRRPVQ